MAVDRGWGGRGHGSVAGRGNATRGEKSRRAPSVARLSVTMSAAVIVPHPARRALITGLTGQDGLYLAEELLAEGTEVVGLVRPGPRPALPAAVAGVPV